MVSICLLTTYLNEKKGYKVMLEIMASDFEETQSIDKTDKILNTKKLFEYYNTDGKLGTTLSSVYSQYPLWMMQQETKLASYGLLAKWNHSLMPVDTVSFRRRLQSKDNTGALRMWLIRHKKNPYPTKPEKIMLAILSRMTMTQVSTWFANARRRLKKEFPENDDFNRMESSDDEQTTAFCQTVYVD